MSQAVLRLRGRLGMLTAAKAGPAAIEQARLELAAAVAEDRITRLIETAPLNAEQRDRLRRLLDASGAAA